MKLFAIICLLLIFVTIQHLINWGWRRFMMKDDYEARDNGGPMLIVFMIGLAASGAMLMTLAKWIIEFQYGVSIPECFVK